MKVRAHVFFRTVILTLILPIQELVYFSMYLSSLISFISVLLFPLHSSFVHLFLDFVVVVVVALVNVLDSLISLLDFWC